MAEIYRVKTVGIAGFEKVLALKRVLPRLAREPRFIRSFVDEARIAVSLNHRNIVQVFDFGKANGELYLAMELIDGIDLRTAVVSAAQAGVALPIGVACHVLADVAAGLDYAHRKHDAQQRSLGIVHCDVSPQNVMLSYEGFVKILDFGVSRARFSGDFRGRLRGKPRYMAPEQTRGEPATPATDVFALGIVAWELLTGLPLFEGETVEDVLAAVRRADAPAVHKLNPDAPRALSRAVWRALGADPEQRGTAAELSEAFAAAAREAAAGAGSRHIATWLAQVFPRRAAPAPPPAVVTSTEDDGDDTAAHRPTLRKLEWSADEAITEVAAGAPEPPPLMELIDKRRVVAVAALLEADADARHELRRGLAELAYKHGAVILQQDDAEVVVVFGLEVAGEDDIAHAMGFCLDAVELARGGARAQVRLAARAGIVAQRRKDGAGYQLVGDSVEEARALARGAEPGRPLVAGGPGRLASAHYAFRELPARRPRSRRLRVLELLGPRSFDDRDRALRARRGSFIGRAAELAAIADAAERAARERRRIAAAIVGAGGVGKSRLVAEAVAGAREGGEPHVIAVAATPAGRDTPFSLIVELFQAALNLPPGRGEAARGKLAQRVTYVLEQVGLDAELVADVTSAVDEAMALRDGNPEHMAGGADQDLRDRVAAALYALRAAVADGDRLRIYVVEDLHFVDAPSAEVLRASLRAPGPSAELVLVTTRSASGLPDAFDVRLDLAELSEAERTALIRDRLAERAEDAAVAAVARRAGGNPLFIEELAEAVREAGADQIPNSAREVILGRVDRLPVAARGALQHAAVVGATVRSRLLEELLGPGVHEQLQLLAEEGLLAAADRGAVDDGEAELRFSHGVIQEVVYDALSQRARRETHARLGHLLASRYRAGREEPPAVIARHFEGGGEPSSAATYWLRAGRLALAAYDAAAARDAFTRALELDAQVTGADRAVSRNRRREAHAGRERAFAQLGQHDAQAADLDALWDLTDRDPRRMADVKNRIAARHLRQGDYAEVVAASREAERYALHSRDVRAQGEAQRVRADAYERLCRFDEALAAARAALELFRASDAPVEETRTLIGIGRIHLFASRYEDARVAYAPALDRVLQLGDPWLERIVRNNIAVIHLCLGEFSAAMRESERSLEICRRYGDRAREGDNLAVCGTILMMVGQYETARERLLQGLAIHDETGSKWSRADGLVYLGATELGLGRVAEGDRRLQEAVDLAREIKAPYIEANAHIARADALLERDPAAALAAARAAIALSRDNQLLSTEIEGLSRVGAAHRQLGELDDALAASTQAVAGLDQQRYIEGPEELVLAHHAALLRTLADPAAASYHRRAVAEIERKLAHLDDPTWRASFAARNAAIVTPG